LTRQQKAFMAGRTPTISKAARIERHAQTISDPIEKLLYLRRATAIHPSHRIFKNGVRWMLSLILIVIVVPLASHANFWSQETPGLTTSMRPHSRADFPNVWIVEQSSQSEMYSNGLRIENVLAVSNQARMHSLLSLGAEGQLGPPRYQPSGIVFHITESDQAPFEVSQSHAITRIGRQLLLYVRSQRAYHFVIDRFGRVHRIVVESDVANHAGNSVWADSQWDYLDLNVSFLGVAFEARTLADQPPINAAQIHAAKVLTEMLRGKYSILPENCITHAQVSVNPHNKMLGWHTDWGCSFPFKDIGLPDNYDRPNPALYLFGFAYDNAYVNSTCPELWKGLALAEERVREGAAERGFSIAAYTKSLQEKYREQLSALRHRSATEEKRK
jgi:hypothetical protein